MVDIIINGYAKFIAILLCFLFLSPAAAVISVVGVAFSSLALHGISRHSEKTAAITHQAMEDMSGSAIEYIRGLSIVKSFGQEGASIESFRKANTNLLTSGRLNEYLAEIDKQAKDMFLRLIKQMSEREGVTEQLKTENQMEWVGRMNNIRSRAVEIVNAELIYS